ncbi:MAG: helix-turn-helix domain-containing protein [Propionibacteriaceae bacterium]|nr:helix-turn-helix domain-containing protein [Propionibacteriaceae bacterium]
MALAFRHLAVTPDDPVAQWGVEGILTAIERGGLAHFRRIAAAVLADPAGPVADDLAEAVTLTDAPVAARFGVLLEEARGGDRARARRRLRDAVAVSGASSRQLAAAVGTSATRLSTYLSGQVQPSAALFLRIERVGRELSRRGPS